MTQVFAISCLFSTLATNPTKAKHFLVETAKNGEKNDAKDYNDCNCKLQLQIAMNKYNKQATAKKEKEKGDCNEVFCCPVSELSKLLQRSILYSSLFQISASEVSHLLKAQSLLCKYWNLSALPGALRTNQPCAMCILLRAPAVAIFQQMAGPVKLGWNVGVSKEKAVLSLPMVDALETATCLLARENVKIFVKVGKYWKISSFMMIQNYLHLLGVSLS